MPASAKDIAKALGVSPSTVSMALHNHPGISNDTKKRVYAMAEEIGYTKHLKNTLSQPQFIQLVFYKKHGNVVGDTPFFAQLTQGIESQTKACGYNLLITYFYDSQDSTEQLRSLLSSNCAGIILLATEMLGTDLDIFTKISVPIVVLDGYFPHYDFDCIGINNVQGACAAVLHLIAKGHSDIGYLSSNVKIRNFRERTEGYLKGIRSLGTLGDHKKIVKITPVAERAIIDMDEYLKTKPKLPTAFFADNDIIATSCMRSLKTAGYRIPEDISIIGFDDTPICDIVDPSLTTMNVPKQSLGILAVNRLIQRIRGETGEIIRLEVLTKLVERHSVQQMNSKHTW